MNSEPCFQSKYTYHKRGARLPAHAQTQICGHVYMHNCNAKNNKQRPATKVEKIDDAPLRPASLCLAHVPPEAFSGWPPAESSCQAPKPEEGLRTILVVVALLFLVLGRVHFSVNIYLHNTLRLLRVCLVAQHVINPCTPL